MFKFLLFFFKVVSIYKGLQSPEDGAIVHGIFIDAGCWDMKAMKLVDAKPGPQVDLLF